MRPQKEDLGRMYRLFSRISGGLDPVAAAFRKHVEADGMTLVRDADAAAAAKKDAGEQLVLQPTMRCHASVTTVGYDICYTSGMFAFVSTEAGADWNNLQDGHRVMQCMVPTTADSHRACGLSLLPCYCSSLAEGKNCSCADMRDLG